jgi:hypothetical protein
MVRLVEGREVVSVAFGGDEMVGYKVRWVGDAIIKRL